MFDDKINDRLLNSSSFNQYSSQITTISTPCDFKYCGEEGSESFLEGSYVSNNPFINISKKTDQSMSHGSPSYVNSNSHDSAMIMKLLQQSKSNDVTASNIRHSNSEMSSSNNLSDEYLWYYLDPRSNVQGPFHDDQMFQWWSQGIYFQNSLLMRRKADAEFSTLQDYSKRFNGVPFNRKDIRVPPLSESLSINHGNNFTSKIFNNGQMSNHPHLHQNPQINDPSVLFQMFPGSPNTTVDEVAKMLHKVNLSNRVPNHLEQSHAIPQMQQNGSEPYMYNDVSSSLSSFVKPHFNNQFQHANTDCKSIPIESYAKHDRVPGPPWNAIPQQATLMDSVWTTKNRDRIPTNHNAVWSQSNSESVVNNNQSILTNIFQDTKPKLPNAIHNDPRHYNPMQDSWDNLDPAIIKMVPSIDAHHHHQVLAVNSQAVHKDNLSPSQRTPPTDAAASSSANSNRLHSVSENTKSPWAEMVRKTNSVSCQKYKSGCNSENEFFTNHSTSPNQHKTSLSSNSSDENDHQSSDPSDKDLESLISWTKNYLENKPGLSGVDISTLVELLSSVESPYEVDALIRENVPEFDNIVEFVKMFLEKRRPLRLKIANDNQKKKSKSPPKPEDAKWQVKSKTQGSAKKKRKNNKNPI